MYMKAFFRNLKKLINKKYTLIIVGLFSVTCFIVYDCFSGFKLRDLIKNNSYFDPGGELEFVLNLNDTTSFINLPFIYPCENINMSSNNYYLEYKYNGIVMATNDGTVKFIGLNTYGQKCLWIAHGQGYITKYEGLEYIGVGNDENVKRGMVIATTNEQTLLKIYILKNNELLSIEDIEWQI